MSLCTRGDILNSQQLHNLNDFITSGHQNMLQGPWGQVHRLLACTLNERAFHQNRGALSSIMSVDHAVIQFGWCAYYMRFPYCTCQINDIDFTSRSCTLCIRVATLLFLSRTLSNFLCISCSCLACIGMYVYCCR